MILGWSHTPSERPVDLRLNPGGTYGDIDKRRSNDNRIDQ